MNIILGRRIRALRESKGFTQEQVAEKMNCTKQKYSRIEEGLIDISYITITNIASVIGIKTNEITSATNNIEEELLIRGKKDAAFEYINEMINTFYAHRRLYNSVERVEKILTH